MGSRHEACQFLEFSKAKTVRREIARTHNRLEFSMPMKSGLGRDFDSSMSGNSDSEVLDVAVDCAR